MGSVRRSSRAGSRQQGTDQVPGEQSMAAIPESFEFDFDNWSPSELRDANGLPLGETGVSASDYFAFNSYGNDYQFNYVAQPFAAPSGGLVGDDVIDPHLLAMTANDPTLQSTPGLTAVPGEGSLMPPMQGVPMYPDPTGMFPVQPYYMPQGYQPQLPYQQHVYQQQAYLQQAYLQQLAAPMPPQPYAPQTALVPSVNSNKRARSYSDSESEAPAKKARVPLQPIRNESEDESDGIVVTKAARARQSKRVRRESRDSGVSSSSSLSKPNGNKVANVGEKPQKCEEKPWVRINGNTKGETTRTARINAEANLDRKYKHMPLPHGDWESNKYPFEYVTHGGIDEFKKDTMSARHINEYITQYPSEDLVLWIQVAPADSVRRYASEEHPKCLFKDCPKRVYDKGTIDVGHFRVAFDEKSKQHGNKVVDPFDCTGYVHLYCLERFCDFERICQEVDVRIDDRVNLLRENGPPGWIFSGRPEEAVVRHFLKACKQGKLHKTDLFKNYPVHESSKKPKAFVSTLTHRLGESNINNRARSQLMQFCTRKLTPNTLIIHLFNVDIAMANKKVMKTTAAYLQAKQQAKKAHRHLDFNFTPFYDDIDPTINQRIAQFTALGQRMLAEDAANGKPRRTKGRGVTKRKRVAPAVQEYDSEPEPEFDDHAGSDSEDLEEVGAYHAAPPTRSSSRKRQRVNYSLEDDELPLPLIHHQQPPQSTQHQQPLPSIAEPQDSYQGYAPSARQPHPGSVSHHFTTSTSTNLADWPAAQSLDPPMDDAEYEQAVLLLRRKSSTVPGTPAPTQAEFDALMAQYLERRKSSTLSLGPAAIKSALRSPKMARGGHQASINLQPVSRTREFGKDDPPTKVAARRSGRLASKAKA
jgi:hypothetical protein